MTQELYLNGILMDLDNSTEISLTIQANKIGDIQNRYGNFAPKFTLPYTQSNKTAIDLSNVITSATNYPYRYARCIYIENGVELISDGLATIDSSGSDNFSVTIMDGNVDFFKAIENLTVGELYADDDTFFWEIYQAINARSGNDYFTFPVVDWYDNDNYFLDGKIDTEKMIPVAIVPDMMTRLQEKIGFTFSGSYIGSDELEQALLTPDEFKLDESDLTSLTTSGKYSGSGYPIGLGGFADIALSEGSGVNVFDLDPFQNIFTGTFTLNTYDPPILQVGTLRFSSTIRISWGAFGYGPFQTHESSTYVIASRIMRTSDNAVIAEVTNSWTGKADLTDVSSPSGFLENYIVVNIETGDITLSPTDTYYVYHYLVATAHTNNDTTLYVYQDETIYSYTPTDIISYGSEIFFTSIFKMTVKDVIMDLLRLHGVFVQTDNYTKRVVFNFWNDVSANKSIAVDWSSKYIHKSKTLFYSSGSYAQKNYCRFATNKDVSEDIGLGSFLIDNTTLPVSTDVIKLNHSATEQNNRYLGLNVPKIKAFDSDNKWTSPGWRILRNKRQNVASGVTWKYQTVEIDDLVTPGISTFTPICDFVGYGVLLNTNHNKFIDSLQDFKGLTADFRLSVLDIVNFDFTIPVQIEVPEEGISGHFYVGKITKGTDGTSRVELMKIQ